MQICGSLLREERLRAKGTLEDVAEGGAVAPYCWDEFELEGAK